LLIGHQQKAQTGQKKKKKNKRTRKNNHSRPNKKEQGKITLAAQIKKISLPLSFRLSLRRLLCLLRHCC
jgi:hypothetical protein